MDRRQSKKRLASTSRSSSPHLKQTRLTHLNTSHISSVSSVSSSGGEDGDSGLETFISDETFDLSSTSPSSFLPFSLSLCTNETLHIESPIIKQMDRMSVMGGARPSAVGGIRASAVGGGRAGQSPKAISSNILQTSKGKRSENFVVGKSINKLEDDDSQICDNKKEGERQFEILRCVRTKPRPSLHSPPNSSPNCSPNSSSYSSHSSHEDKENWPGYRRSSQVFFQHPEIEAEMRSILLAWLMEVSKAYCLRRKTYHMALDFVDRFLSSTEHLPKNLLQLVGVASLSLAAKIEEIFPPELKEMAYVTAEAHTRAEIKSMEKIIFSALGTALMPSTPGDCVGLYLQKAGLVGVSEEEKISDPMEDTKIARQNWLPFKLYSKICRVIDLALLDAESLSFSYRQISATAMYLIDKTKYFPKTLIDEGEFRKVSDERCTKWMQHFVDGERALCQVTSDSPCEDPRHNHHRIMWPHLQLYNFTLEDFLAIMEGKKEEEKRVLENESRDGENGESNWLVEDLIERLLDDVLPCAALMSPPSSKPLASKPPAPPLGSMYLTPPDSRRQSCASNDGRQISTDSFYSSS